MNIKRIIRKRAVSLVLAFLMAISCMLSPVGECSVAAADSGPAAVSDSGLGAAQGYNLVCFGSFNNGSTDILGKSFIGGEIDCRSGFKFGSDVTSGYGLVLGVRKPGHFHAGDNNTPAAALVYDSAVSNDITNTEHSEGHKYTFGGGIDTWNDTGTLKTETGIDLTETKYHGKTITEFQKEMIKKSDFLSKLTPNGKVYYNYSMIVLRGTNKDRNVFSVDGSVDALKDNLKQLSGIYIDVPENSTVIVNLTGEHVGITGGGVYSVKNTVDENGQLVNGFQNTKHDEYPTEELQSKLLWNCSGAKTVELQGSINGSILAPEAKLLSSGYGQFLGEIIVDSFDTEGKNLEGHDFPFDGELPEEESQPTLNKTATLDSWDGRTYDITLTVPYQNDASEESDYEDITVTDTIDPSFEVGEASKARLKADGAKIEPETVKDATAQVITWKLKKETAASSCWSVTFRVKARDQFIGGNNIPTNVEDNSGVKYGTGSLVKFPLPAVNVKPNLVGNAEATIFLGEIVPKDNADSCRKWRDEKVVYQWFRKADETVSEEIEKPNTPFPAGLCPDNTTSYILKARADAGTPMPASTENSKGNVAGKEGVMEGIGTYTVTVVKGELVITKDIVRGRKDTDADRKIVKDADSGQFFTFKIERYNSSTAGSSGGRLVSTSYEVLYTDKGTGSITIADLPYGRYKVTEISNSAWRYTLNESSSLNQTVFLGRNKSDSSQPFITCEKIGYKNYISNNKWISGRGSVTNVLKTTVPEAKE